MIKILEKFKKLYKKHPKATIGVPVAVVLAIILAISLSGGKTKVTNQTEIVEKGTIVSTVSASGQILSSNIVSIKSNASGMVKKVYVKDGDKVVAGQKIAELSLDNDGQERAQSAYAAYLSAKNNLESARISLYTLQSSAFATNQKLINDAVARNLSTGDPTYIQQNADWLAAEAKYKNQQNVITQSQVSLSNAWSAYQSVSATITAPTSGNVTNLMLTEGMTLNGSTDVSQRVAVIKSEGTPIASVNVSEIDVSKIKQGLKATIILDSITDKTFTGVIVGTDKIGATSSGVTTYPALIKFDTKSDEILPNMSVTANIVIETKSNVLMVSSAAVKNQNGEYTVKVIKNGKESSVTVETGLTSDTKTEITSGLSEGDEVVISSSTSTTGTSSARSVFNSTRGAGGGQMFAR
jgi:RND family efflux transporter MFP subunit